MDTTDRVVVQRKGTSCVTFFTSQCSPARLVKACKLSKCQNKISFYRLRRPIRRGKPDHGKYHKTYRFLRALYNTARLVTSDIMHDECGKPVARQINKLTTRMLTKK